MSLTQKPTYIHEPTWLQCGQAVLAMLSGKSVEEIIELVGTEKETTLKDMKAALNSLGIECSANRVQVYDKSELPEVCILSLETPHCWHWSLYFKGLFYDPEYGIVNDFPPSERRYFWEISKKI